MAGPSADKAESGVIYAPSFQENVYQGAHGNESVVEAYVTLDKAAEATEIRLLKLPIGMRINSVQITTDGLGDSETITIKSGSHELVHADDVHTKTAQLIVVPPYTTQTDGELLTATTGGSAATGSVSILVRYVVVGY